MRGLLLLVCGVAIASEIPSFTEYSSRWTSASPSKDGDWHHFLSSKHIEYGGAHVPGTPYSLQGYLALDPAWYPFLVNGTVNCENLCAATTCFEEGSKALDGQVVLIHMFNSYVCGFPYDSTAWIAEYEKLGAVGLLYYSLYGVVLMSAVCYQSYWDYRDPISIPWFSISSTLGGN